MEFEEIFDEEINKIQKQCGSLYSIGEKERIKKLFKKLVKMSDEQKDNKNIEL